MAASRRSTRSSVKTTSQWREFDPIIWGDQPPDQEAFSRPSGTCRNNNAVCKSCCFVIASGIIICGYALRLPMHAGWKRNQGNAEISPFWVVDWGKIEPVLETGAD